MHLGWFNQMSWKNYQPKHNRNQGVRLGWANFGSVVDLMIPQIRRVENESTLN